MNEKETTKEFEVFDCHPTRKTSQQLEDQEKRGKGKRKKKVKMFQRRKRKEDSLESVEKRDKVFVSLDLVEERILLREFSVACPRKVEKDVGKDETFFQRREILRFEGEERKEMRSTSNKEEKK